MKKTFLQNSRTGKSRIWTIEVEREKIHIEFGEEGGRLQTVTDVASAKNVGRSNEVSAEQAALDEAERLILAKTRQGYWEKDGQPRQEVELDLMHPTTQLCFYKPDNTVSPSLMKKLEDGKVWLTRKRDGEMMPTFITADGVEIFSRRMLPFHDKEPGVPWAERFPHLVEALLALNLPEGTVLLGDMIVNRKGSDDRWAAASILKSKLEDAIVKQTTGPKMSYYIWDIAFLNGEDLLATKTARERFDLLHKLLNGASEYLIPVEIHLPQEFSPIDPEELAESDTFQADKGHIWNAACFFAKELGWEGFVVVDPDGIYGDKGWNLRGKPDRPGRYCGKLKPEFEDDFVAMWDPDNGIGEYGSGKYLTKIGAVQLYQYDKNGELQYISKCGNGWTAEFLSANSHPSKFPMVMKVKYSSRTYKSQGAETNALQFPAFVEIRTDKTELECVNEEL